MAGTWTAQNKKRPGAYIVFKGVKTDDGLTTGDRGIVTVPLALPWGDTANLIKITLDDYTQGGTLKLIGLSATDAAIQPIREIFKGATEILAWRLGGTTAAKATGTLFSGVTATAVWGGTYGNKITISSVANSSKFDVVTTVDGTEVDRQTVATIDDYAANGWVTLQGDTGTAFQAFDGVPLSGGTDGTQSSSDYTAYFAAAAQEIWQTMALYTTDASVKQQAVTYINDRRENDGLKSQLVINDYSDADYEGVISVDQGYVTDSGETVDVSSFVCYAAGITAGAGITDSNTYRVINGAVSIINPKTSDEIDAGLTSGKMMLIKRQDRSIVIIEDINTLHTYSADRTASFSDNRVIRCLDDIATQVGQLFEDTYIGKVSNDASGRALFKASVVSYLNNLQAQGAIENFDPSTDVEVLAGADIHSVVCNIWIQVVGAMEKLYLTVYVG